LGPDANIKYIITGAKQKIALTAPKPIAKFAPQLQVRCSLWLCFQKITKNYTASRLVVAVAVAARSGGSRGRLRVC